MARRRLGEEKKALYPFHLQPTTNEKLMIILKEEKYDSKSSWLEETIQKLWQRREARKHRKN